MILAQVKKRNSEFGLVRVLNDIPEGCFFFMAQHQDAGTWEMMDMKKGLGPGFIKLGLRHTNFAKKGLCQKQHMVLYK